MPPRTAAVAASGVFDFTSLLFNLPRTSRTDTYTKCSACLFSTSPVLETIAKKRKKRKVNRYTDPYRAAQARQRKAANIARQGVLQRERQEAMGDPVRSMPTPFISTLSSRQSPDAISPRPLNYFLQPQELQNSVNYSKWLTEPLSKEHNAVKPIQSRGFGADEEDKVESQPGSTLDPKKEAHEARHENAKRAMAAITALENSSSADRTRLNIQRCIEEFGRHKTDMILGPRSASTQTVGSSETAGENTITGISEKGGTSVPTRSGPDTGSSEVQAAILTAKINVLADNLGKKDKHNKRNLRLLVHKRQKMLSYLRQKERGGPRWQNLVEKLGIGDAMWKGEISL